MPDLEDDEFHDLPAGARVSTDPDGEAILRVTGCDLTIYLFQDGELRRSPCSKAQARSGNITCAARGTMAFNNKCGSKVVIETPTAEFALQGTWVSTSYFPERQLTLLWVFEGEAQVQPVTDRPSRSMGEGRTVPTASFWFSTPGEESESLAGLAGREAHPWDQLPAVSGVGMEEWLPRLRARPSKTESNSPTSTQAPDRPHAAPTVAPTETPPESAPSEPPPVPTEAEPPPVDAAPTDPPEPPLDPTPTSEA
ncbi:MAG: hypothetical protein WKH64_04540 [Chloroflexia bacterium]